MRVLSSCGMGSLARGLKSTRYDTEALEHHFIVKMGQLSFLSGIISTVQLHVWLHGSLGLNYPHFVLSQLLRFPLLYFQEHEKRCWSVDFNLMDPKLLASGSDDAKGNTIIQQVFRHKLPIICLSSFCYTLQYFYTWWNVHTSVFVFQWSYGQPILTTQWPASRPRPMSAVLNSVQPPGITWPLAAQVRSWLGLGCLCPVEIMVAEDKTMYLL